MSFVKYFLFISFCNSFIVLDDMYLPPFKLFSFYIYVPFHFLLFTFVHVIVFILHVYVEILTCRCNQSHSGIFLNTLLLHAATLRLTIYLYQAFKV